MSRVTGSVSSIAPFFLSKMSLDPSGVRVCINQASSSLVITFSSINACWVGYIHTLDILSLMLAFIYWFCVLFHQQISVQRGSITRVSRLALSAQTAATAIESNCLKSR